MDFRVATKNNSSKSKIPRELPRRSKFHSKPRNKKRYTKYYYPMPL